MCVGLSARVVSVKGGSAVIDASGARRTVSAELLDELEPGDYVMVHAGIAIAKISQSSEEESAQIMEKLDENKSGNN
jgi:hydrogenase expression/formation protein HypC